MIDLFSGLDAWVLVSLLLALAFVLTFEFINGFHDTANAVATVIYTKAMAPHLAVFLSGAFNFLGVLLGGVGVAYAIVRALVPGGVTQLLTRQATRIIRGSTPTVREGSEVEIV